MPEASGLQEVAQLGRKNKYESNVKPHLKDIPKWYEVMTEGQIAKKLGISVASFENYKLKYPELVACLQRGKEVLVDDLKDSLRKKAKGFYYTETKKTYIENEYGQQVGAVKIEATEKYAAPDTGAIHLLLKNLDDTWRNDDKTTIDLKRDKLDLDKQKAEAEAW